MPRQNTKTSAFSFDSRSFAQWLVTYAVVVWFMLEVLDFLIGIYGGSTEIVRVATTFGITSVTILTTVYWFVAKQQQTLNSVAATIALSISIVFVSICTFKTGAPELSWSVIGTASVIATTLIVVLINLSMRFTESRPKVPDTEDSKSLEEQTSSIAVLPFRSLSVDQEDGFFAEGLAEEILNALARIPDLQVASRSSSFAFAQTADSKSIATKLGVNYLLEGSVRKSSDKLRVSVQLTQASNGYALWSKTYNSVLDDIFDVQDQISKRVASALKSTLWESTVESSAQRRTKNSEAYREYLLAMHYDRNMHQGGTEELEKVRQHAERAVELDKNFVPGWIILADVYLNRMGYRMPKEQAHALARTALSNALTLEPDNPEVILQLAELARGDQQYDEALGLYRRARTLDRTSPQVDYATLLYTTGELDLALKEFEHCINLDPENFSLWYYYACALLSKGETASALETYEKSLEIAADGFLSDGVRATLAGITYLYEDQEKGRAILAPCLLHNPNRIDFEHGLIAGIRSLMGDPSTAAQVAADLEAKTKDEHIDPQALFWAYFGTESQDNDRLFYWMSRIIEEDAFPTIYFLKTWPPLDRFRDDPRYKAQLQAAALV